MSEPGKRVRAVNDGQLGFIVQDESGALMVRLDRGPRQEQLLPYRPSDWIEDTRRELSPMQVARVAYEADKALRTVGGEYGVKDWIGLREHEHQKWVSAPPLGDDQLRRALHAAIVAALQVS